MYWTLDEDDIHVKIRLKMQTSRHWQIVIDRMIVREATSFLFLSSPQIWWVFVSGVMIPCPIWVPLCLKRAPLMRAFAELGRAPPARSWAATHRPSPLTPIVSTPRSQSWGRRQVKNSEIFKWYISDGFLFYFGVLRDSRYVSASFLIYFWISEIFKCERFPICFCFISDIFLMDLWDI